MAVPREGSKIAEFKSIVFLLNVYLLFIYCLFTSRYDKLAEKTILSVLFSFNLSNNSDRVLHPCHDVLHFKDRCF